MAFPNVATKSNGFVNSGDPTVTLPASCAVGDLVLIFLALGTQCSITAEPAGWTLITSSSGSTYGGFVYGRIITGGEANPTWNLTAYPTPANRYAAWGAYRYDASGSIGFSVTANVAIAKSSWNVWAAGTIDAPALTVPVDWGSGDYSWMTANIAGFVFRPTGITFPPGWTNDSINAYSSGASLGAQMTIGTIADSTASSRDPGNWTHQYNYGSHQNRCVTLAVRFATDAPTTPLGGPGQLRRRRGFEDTEYFR